MKKIKHFIDSEKGKDTLIILIVILVGLGSFELGRLSKENNSEGLKIEYTGTNMPQSLGNQPASPISASTNTKGLDSQNSTSEKNYFASSRGSKYYSVGCSAGKTIKQENRVYFSTGEEAEASGYTLSSSCI